MGLDEQVEALKKRLEQLKARQSQVRARERALAAKQSRAADTRRKILVGALFLDRMDRDDQLRSSVLADLSAYLTRPDDRALFGLPTLQPDPQPDTYQPDTYQSQPSYQPNYQNTQD